MRRRGIALAAAAAGSLVLLFALGVRNVRTVPAGPPSPSRSLPTVHASVRVVATAPNIAFATPDRPPDSWSPDGGRFVLAVAAEQTAASEGYWPTRLYGAEGDLVEPIPGWCGWLTSFSYLRCPKDISGMAQVDLPSGDVLVQTQWYYTWSHPDGEGHVVQCDDTLRCSTGAWSGQMAGDFRIALAGGGGRVAVRDGTTGSVDVFDTASGEHVRKVVAFAPENALMTFSPNADAIAVSDAGHLMLVNIDSGTTVWPDVPLPASWGWTYDGRLLVADTGRELVRAWDVDGREVASGIAYAPSLEFSRAGAYVGLEAAATDRLVLVTPEARVIAELPGPVVGSTSLSPDGRFLLAVVQAGSSQSVVEVALPGASAVPMPSPTATPQPTAALTGRVVADGPALGLFDPWSSDGRHFVVTDANPARHRLFDAQGRDLGSAPEWCGWYRTDAYFRCPVNSRGLQVRQAMVDLGTGNETANAPAVWLQAADGQGNAVACDESLRCSAGQWHGQNVSVVAMSQGGSLVAFTTQPPARIEVVAAATGRTIWSLDRPLLNGIWTAFSPDGSAFAFDDGGGMTLVNLASGTAVSLGAGGDWCWTADNRLVTVHASTRRIRAWNTEGREVVAPLPYAPKLAHARSGAVVGVDTSSGIAFVTPSTRFLVTLPGRIDGDPWLSPDGRSVLLVVKNGAIRSIVLVTLPE